MELIQKLLENEEVLALLAVLVGFLVKQFLKNQKEDRRALVLGGINLAYNIVNDISKTTKNTIDDKAALGLMKLNEYLSTEKARPLSADEAAKAKLAFSALHGAEERVVPPFVPAPRLLAGVPTPPSDE